MILLIKETVIRVRMKQCDVAVTACIIWNLLANIQNIPEI